MVRVSHEMLRELRASNRDAHEKIRFVLDTHHLWSEEGTYTFPDGDTWYRGESDG